MPIESEKQRAFFQLCRTNPSRAREQCPDEDTLDEYLGRAKKRTGGRLDAIKGKLRREKAMVSA